jgi:hypothetical protein
MPVKKKKDTAKKTAKTGSRKPGPAKKKAGSAAKSLPVSQIPLPGLMKKSYTVYIGPAAFFPGNSEYGYIDLFQEGRCTAVPNRDLYTPIAVPVGATLTSISIHYINTTANPVLCLFLRLHADRVSPSGEIEMSFINLPPDSLPPDNYLTVTDNSFPDGNIVQDRFLHYLEIQGTGDFGTAGKVTVRGVSFTYLY